MNKEFFLQKFRGPQGRIRVGGFDEKLFLSRADIEVIETTHAIKDFASFHAPWYYLPKDNSLNAPIRL